MVSANKSVADKIRFQLDVTADQIETFSRLEALCGFSTRKELFNNAMTLFEWAVEEVTKGNMVASVNPETERYTELSMPSLRQAARSRNKASSISPL